MKRICALAMVMLGMAATLPVSATTFTLYPAKDGTLVDGGVFGPFDGVADDADWYFNQSSYEGSISRSTASPTNSIEHRVTWEYNLSTVTLPPPVSATLRFNLRGASIFPFPDVDVHVYAYPADLAESLSDFSATPATFQGLATVVPFQPATTYTVDVSAAVSAALSSGTDKVAFRFQIDPNTTAPANQAFVDALDAEPATKPALLVVEAPHVPGDIDDDGDVDAEDFLGFPPCMSGPDTPPTPECDIYDFDLDDDVDLADYAAFQSYIAP